MPTAAELRRAALLAATLVALPAASHAAGDLLYLSSNFVLLLAVLTYFARKPIIAFFSDRRSAIQRDIDAASELLGLAEGSNAQIERKLLELDQELERIRTTARERAESEREQILADAEASAERIRNDARAAVDQEVFRAREQLRKEAADLAVELAADQLRSQVTDADRGRLMNDLIDRIEAPETTAAPRPGGEG